jgi:hypothetical protein
MISRTEQNWPDANTSTLPDVNVFTPGMLVTSDETAHSVMYRVVSVPSDHVVEIIRLQPMALKTAHSFNVWASDLKVVADNVWDAEAISLCT